MPEKSISVIEVRVTRYDQAKLRLVQVLVPLAMVMFPIARRLNSIVIALPAALVGAAVIGMFLAARKSQRTNLSVSPGRVQLEGMALRAADAVRWRWLGRSARLFTRVGQIVVTPRSAVDCGALQSALQAALGPPQRYRRRGSGKARAISLAITILGLVMLGIGYVNRLPYLMSGVIVAIVGLAVFAALSGSVPETSSPSRRD